MSLLSAKAMGATGIVITDLDQGRLDMALKLGAHHALRVDTRDPEEMARRVEEALGCKPDVSVECSGAEPSIQTGIYVSMQCCVLCVWHSLPACSRGGVATFSLSSLLHQEAILPLSQSIHYSQTEAWRNINLVPLL